MPSPEHNIQSGTPILSVDQLSVSYGKHRALHGLSLDIKPGELVGVIGPNGAGKTSFIKALCGRVDISGKIAINGTQLKRGMDRRRSIALVPQDIGLYPHLTATENLDVIGRLLGLSDREIINTALKSVDMVKHADVRVSAMSGGMKRRINVAAAVLTDPSLIIFDEPTAGVDVPARDTLHRLARHLTKQGKAVILVTHELEQAEALCDKVLVLCEGKKLAFDTPSRLLQNAFQDQREIRIRFAVPPNRDMLEAMHPFEFKQDELPTIWSTMTNANEVSFVSAFMTSLRGGGDLLREISVRRPGLTALMHRIEQTSRASS